MPMLMSTDVALWTAKSSDVYRRCKWNPPLFCYCPDGKDHRDDSQLPQGHHGIGLQEFLWQLEAMVEAGGNYLKMIWYHIYQ